MAMTPAPEGPRSTDRSLLARRPWLVGVWAGACLFAAAVVGVFLVLDSDPATESPTPAALSADDTDDGGDDGESADPVGAGQAEGEGEGGAEGEGETTGDGEGGAVDTPPGGRGGPTPGQQSADAVAGEAPPTDPAGCDLSYSGACVPPPPASVSCADLGTGNIVINGTDPHGLDTDGDGLGCEPGGEDDVSVAADTTPGPVVRATPDQVRPDEGD